MLDVVDALFASTFQSDAFLNWALSTNEPEGDGSGAGGGSGVMKRKRKKTKKRRKGNRKTQKCRK